MIECDALPSRPAMWYVGMVIVRGVAVQRGSGLRGSRVGRLRNALHVQLACFPSRFILRWIFFMVWDLTMVVIQSGSSAARFRERRTRCVCLGGRGVEDMVARVLQGLRSTTSPSLRSRDLPISKFCNKM